MKPTSLATVLPVAFLVLAGGGANCLETSTRASGHDVHPFVEASCTLVRTQRHDLGFVVFAAGKNATAKQSVLFA